MDFVKLAETANAVAQVFGGWQAIALGIVSTWTLLQEVRHRANVKPLYKDGGANG
jgi:hypothetical protein